MAFPSHPLGGNFVLNVFSVYIRQGGTPTSPTLLKSALIIWERGQVGGKEMYSTPLVEAVSLCRKDFRISWEGGGRRERERKEEKELSAS